MLTNGFFRLRRPTPRRSYHRRVSKRRAAGRARACGRATLPHRSHVVLRRKRNVRLALRISAVSLRYSAEEARRCQNEREDGITPHESSRSVISPCADVHVLVAAAAALQTLCGLGCLEKEGKIVTYAKQAAARTTRSDGRGRAIRKSSPRRAEFFFHGVKWRRDCLDTTDGRGGGDECSGADMRVL